MADLLRVLKPTLYSNAMSAPALAVFAYLYRSSKFTEFARVNLLTQLAVFIPSVQIPALITGRLSYVDIAWPTGLLAMGIVNLLRAIYRIVTRRPAAAESTEPPVKSPQQLAEEDPQVQQLQQTIKHAQTNGNHEAARKIAAELEPLQQLLETSFELRAGDSALNSTDSGNGSQARAVLVSLAYIFQGGRMAYGAWTLFSAGHLRTEMQRYTYQRYRWAAAGIQSGSLAEVPAGAVFDFMWRYSMLRVFDTFCATDTFSASDTFSAI